MISSLKSEKKIELLFNEGSLIKKEGLLLKFYFFNDSLVKYGVSVPKKNFKMPSTSTLYYQNTKSGFPIPNPSLILYIIT